MITVWVDKKIFNPGDVVEGKVTWNLETAPKSLEARLFWYTQGRGTEDLVIVDSVAFDAVQQGEKHFRLRLPEGPYTFSGKLISLIWSVEFVANPSDECSREDIIVSPMGGEIILGESA